MQSTESFTRNGKLALRPEVVVTVLDDGAVLLDLETKYFFALNGSAWTIVQLFESGASLDEARSLANDAGAPHDETVDQFLNRLCDYGLVEPMTGNGLPAMAIEAVSADNAPRVPWCAPTIDRQSEPLQAVIVSAFDPSIPLAE